MSAKSSDSNERTAFDSIATFRRRQLWEVALAPYFSCKHATTFATKSHPKSACLLQRSSGGCRGRLSEILHLHYAISTRSTRSEQFTEMPIARICEHSRKCHRQYRMSGPSKLHSTAEPVRTFSLAESEAPAV